MRSRKKKWAEPYLEQHQELVIPDPAVYKGKWRELLGTQWVETDRLFVKWNGEPMGSSTTYNWLKKVCKRNNIRFCDLHSLRHFHASVLIFAGVDPVTVSRDMGHSCPTTTTSIYCHLFQEAQARTCDILANTLSFGKNDSKKTA